MAESGTGKEYSQGSEKQQFLLIWPNTAVEKYPVNFLLQMAREPYLGIRTSGDREDLPVLGNWVVGLELILLSPGRANSVLFSWLDD